MSNKIGSIKTGVTSTLKLDAEDAKKKAEATVQKAEQEMAKAEKQLEQNQIMYRTVGEPVFNCSTPSGIAINFKGGAFICKKSDSEVVETLQYFVDKGLIYKVEPEKE